MAKPTLREFLNRVRSLYNINGWLLDDALTKEQQLEFVRNPAKYFINTDFVQQQAIFREVEKRQVGYE